MDQKISIGSLSIPSVGLGTYLCSDEEARVSVSHALKHGYRHIDTAEFYANHKGIAAGIAEAGVARNEIFITDKVNPGGLFDQPQKSFEEIQTSMKDSLAQLECEYVDMYLIHHAGAKDKRLEQWRALVGLQQEGLVRHIGVSNFSIAHLEEIKVGSTCDAGQGRAGGVVEGEHDTEHSVTVMLCLSLCLFVCLPVFCFIYLAVVV